MNWLINFTPADFANLEQCKKSFKSPIKQKEIDELIEKIKALNPENISDVDIDEILSKTTFCNFSCKINNVLLYSLKILSYFCKKITVWMKPKSNGQETKTQKKWSRSQGQEEMGEKKWTISKSR